MCLLPARPGWGVRYALGHDARGEVVLDSVPVRADLSTATNRDRCICIEDGDTIITNVEHLNAVLAAFGIDNTTVVLEKRGVWRRIFRRQALPLLADSTASFVAAIDEVGLVGQDVPRRVRTVVKPCELVDPARGDRVAVVPAEGLTVTCTGGYAHLGIPDATLTITVEPDAYREDISRARTLMNQYTWLPLGALRFGSRFVYPRYGLGTGVSAESMLIMVDGRALGAPRYGGTAAEFVRHKVMDFLGAMALVGPLNNCHFTVVKSSHRHDLAFFRAVAPHLTPLGAPASVAV